MRPPSKAELTELRSKKIVEPADVYQLCDQVENLQDILAREREAREATEVFDKHVAAKAIEDLRKLKAQAGEMHFEFVKLSQEHEKACKAALQEAIEVSKLREQVRDYEGRMDQMRNTYLQLEKEVAAMSKANKVKDFIICKQERTLQGVRIHLQQQVGWWNDVSPVLRRDAAGREKLPYHERYKVIEQAIQFIEEIKEMIR
jgi:vacuolar-type H+-ATPase subunit I/STV1